MKAQLTPAIFRYISKEISTGRPLWGILRANEYLERESPIRKALALKAKQLLGELDKDLLGEIIDSGATLGELEPAKAAKLHEVQEQFNKARHNVVRLPNRRSYAKRKESLRELRAANG